MLVVNSYIFYIWICRGNFPPAAEYVQHADRSTASLVETFRNMQIEEDEHLENGGLDYEVEVNFSFVPLDSSLLFVILHIFI